MSGRAAGERWVAVLGGRRERWGGERRRRHIFRRLAERTGGQIVTGWSWEGIAPALEAGRRRLPFLRPHGTRPKLVSGEMLAPDVMRRVARVADPVAVAIYDDPLPHWSALGVELAPDEAAALTRKKEANVAAFRWKVMPTQALAELAGIPVDTVIAGENGTDAERIVPGVWPEDPAIGFNSGSHPGRGIETLIEAARLLKSEIPALRLLLWLVSTGPESAAHLDGIRTATRGERWIQIDPLSPDDYSAAYRQATLFCIPHPANPYYDAALPVKMFDAMAAGRPLVITPRTETRRVVERHGVGTVTDGDGSHDLADAMRRLLLDEAEAKRIGAVARGIAENVYDWRMVGDRIADAILEREGITSGR
jgi:glycosyltransferase involved in cell wall biosynthesis